MNIFNRLVMVLLMLALLGLAFILTVWPYTWMFVAEQMTDLSRTAQPWYTLVGVLVMLVAGLLLLMEVRRPRRAKYVLVDQVSGGDARVQVDSVSRRLNYQVDLLQDVTEVKSTILAKGRGLRLTLDVVMSPDVDVPMKTSEIIETARRVVEEDMGLRLAGKPREAITVSIRHPKEMPSPAQRPLPPVTTDRPVELADLDLGSQPPYVEPAPEPPEKPEQKEEEWKPSA